MSTTTGYPPAGPVASPVFDLAKVPEDPYDAIALDDLRQAFPHHFPTCQGGARAARGGQRPPLDTYANNVGSGGSPEVEESLIRTQERTQFHLFRKWRLRRGLQRLTGNKRVKGCGWARIHPEGKVALRISVDGKPGYSGFAHCGKVWLCPVCSAKIETRRRGELEQLVHYVVEHGYVLAFGTYTLRHRRGQALEPLWDGLSAGWRAVRQSRAVRRLRKEYGCVGVIKAVEITHGKHGWHPHLHTIHVFNPPRERLSTDGTTTVDFELGQEHIAELHAAEVRAWRASAKAQRLTAPLARGQQLRLVDTADVDDVVAYVAKHDRLGEEGTELRRQVRTTADKHPGRYVNSRAVGFEMAGASTKKGRQESRTMMELLQDLVADGDADDYLLWQEFERVSQGRHSLDWPAGLKALIGLKDVSDDEIVNEVEGGSDVLTFNDGRAIFQPLSAAPAILAAAGTGGVEAAMEVCDFYGVDYLIGDHGVTQHFLTRAEEARTEARNNRIEQQAFERQMFELMASHRARAEAMEVEAAARDAYYGHGLRLIDHAWQLNQAALEQGQNGRFYVAEVPIPGARGPVWETTQKVLTAVVLPVGHPLLVDPRPAPGMVKELASKEPGWPRREVVMRT